MSPRRFTLTADHLTLLRAANVDWNGDECGAPSIDPKRPYGNGDVIRDIHRLLYPDDPWDDDHGLPASLSPEQWPKRFAEYEALHLQTKIALQIVLATGSFVAGEYVLEKDYTRDWRPALFLCGGCNVRPPWEHRCHTRNMIDCPCEDCADRSCECAECHAAVSD